MFGLFSGGHDSLCSTHVVSSHPLFAGVVHLNTGIGIEETRVFVRETCEREGWPLIELKSPHKYEDLVLERGGFGNGPKSHNSFYWFLKQKQIRAFVMSQKTNHYDRIGLVTGIRKQESVRRMNKGITQYVKREGARYWLNPILDWTQKDKNDYILAQNLPRNQVVDILHKSGECLCGALAVRSEFQEIKAWYPDVAKRIENLQNECQLRGIKHFLWGERQQGRPDYPQHTLPLCSSCIK